MPSPTVDAPTGRVLVPGYPRGWFQIAYADEVPPGQVVARRYFGRDLAVFRTAGGTVQAVDAYCAHLGAHLAVGGTVAGECLRCPFHAWEYGVDGRVQAIPYATRIPNGAAVRAWPTVERSGIVFLWYADGALEPEWDPPALEEHGDPAWTGYLRQRYVLRTSPHEIVENVFDPPHGMYLHGNAGGMAPPVVDFEFAGHTATARFQIDIPTVGGATTHVSTVYGLGIVTNRSVGYGTKSFYSTYTPVDREHVEVNFSFLTPASTTDDPTGERSQRSAAGTLAAFEQDIPIWEHKTFRPVPLLCDGDPAIARFRVWARQFHQPADAGAAAGRRN